MTYCGNILFPVTFDIPRLSTKQRLTSIMEWRVGYVRVFPYRILLVNFDTFNKLGKGDMPMSVTLPLKYQVW